MELFDPAAVFHNMTILFCHRRKVAARYPRRPTYRIDFFSHQVEVNGRDKFEVA